MELLQFTEENGGIIWKGWQSVDWDVYKRQHSRGTPQVILHLPFCCSNAFRGVFLKAKQMMHTYTCARALIHIPRNLKTPHVFALRHAQLLLAKNVLFHYNFLFILFFRRFKKRLNESCYIYCLYTIYDIWRLYLRLTITFSTLQLSFIFYD